MIGSIIDASEKMLVDVIVVGEGEAEVKVTLKITTGANLGSSFEVEIWYIDRVCVPEVRFVKTLCPSKTSHPSGVVPLAVAGNSKIFQSLLFAIPWSRLPLIQIGFDATYTFGETSTVTFRGIESV